MNKVIAATHMFNNKVYVILFDGVKYWLGDNIFDSLLEARKYLAHSIIKPSERNKYNRW